MARRKLYRNTITFVVYTEDDRLDHCDPSHEDLKAILDETIDGRYIGLCTGILTERVTSMRQLRSELVEIGNDGTFFDVDP